MENGWERVEVLLGFHVYLHTPALKQEGKIQKTEYKAPVISKKQKTSNTELAFPPELYPLSKSSLEPAAFKKERETWTLLLLGSFLWVK